MIVPKRNFYDTFMKSILHKDILEILKSENLDKLFCSQMLPANLVC